MERIAVMMTDMNYGGVETVIMNYYRRIDKTKYQFDFFVLEGSQIPQREEIESMGGRLYVVPRYSKPWTYCKKVYEIFEQNHYKIVHSNMNTLSVFPLCMAKKTGIPVRIAHNHSTAAKGEGKKNIAKYLLRPLVKMYATDYLACSRMAGEWMFGKKTVAKGRVHIINNAIEIEDYKFNREKRIEIREKYGISDKEILIGCIGRLCFQKNQEFLIKVLEKLGDSTIKLMFIGDGEDKRQLEEETKKLGIERQVIIVPGCSDVKNYYSAFDIFAMPSRYEGWGMVAVEAQVNGLSCVLSDKFPEEVAMTERANRIALEVNKWVEEIDNQIKIGTERTVIEKSDNHLFDNYDVKIQIKYLQEYYESKSCSFCNK